MLIKRPCEDDLVYKLNRSLAKEAAEVRCKMGAAWENISKHFA
jgi:hypothetical protein